jgi:hypothetical protein
MSSLSEFCFGCLSEIGQYTQKHKVVRDEVQGKNIVGTFDEEDNLILLLHQIATGDNRHHL